MTEKIALELTLEELILIDKYIEYHDYDCDKPLLEKIRNAYPHRSHIEEAYKEVYGWYPPITSSVSNYEDNRWRAFQNGYNASQVIETPQERGERVHKETEELITKIHDGHRVVEYQPTPQEPEEEPEELKTLYQMLDDKKHHPDTCVFICDIVKEWMSQYTHNVMTGEYLKGYEECLTVLEENLK